MGAAAWPLWPSRLSQLLQNGSAAEPAGFAPAAREETWLLLRAALIRCLERQARRAGRVSREDLEDLASDKSLELVLAAEAGKWRVEDRSAGEIAGYLAAVARNALVDHLRRTARLTADGGLESPEGGEGPPAGDGGPGPPCRELRRLATLVAPEQPDAVAERREFSAGLRECVGKLAARSRLVWFFRAFCEMSAREIAAHPEIDLKPAHVDVMLHRSRHLVGECMRRKGFDPSDLPAGAFVELWQDVRVPVPGAEGGAREDHESRRTAFQPPD